jgi:hypothetical protein
VPKLTVTVRQRTPGLLGKGIAERARTLVAANEAAMTAAAATATEATRASWAYKRPADAPKRPGRSSTGGQFVNELSWVARNGEVEFDVAKADRGAEYWIIQEIGTGNRATLKHGGSANPQGRPKTGADYVRSVKSQVGRQIPGSLVFASGPGGRYSPAGSRRGEQLYLRSKIRGVPIGPHTAARAIYIGKEIEGQHFVRTGGQQGFQEYRPSVLAAARRAFAGQGYRP